MILDVPLVNAPSVTPAKLNDRMPHGRRLNYAKKLAVVAWEMLINRDGMAALDTNRATLISYRRC
jgi:hypothetical protein